MYFYVLFYNKNNMDDFFAAIGYGGIQLWKIMPRLNNEYLRRKRKGNQNLKNSFEDVFQNTDNPCSRAGCVKLNKALNFDIKFSRCCGPIPGDEIIGFITNKKPYIMHFVGPEKPWVYDKAYSYNYDFINEWWQLFKQTPFIEDNDLLVREQIKKRENIYVTKNMLQTIFSLKNSSEYKIMTLLGMQYKFQRKIKPIKVAFGSASLIYFSTPYLKTASISSVALSLT